MLYPNTSTFWVVHGSQVTSGMVSVAFMYSVCVYAWFTWCTGSPGALVYRARPISLAYWKLELGIEKSELLPTAYTQLPVSERNGSSLIDYWGTSSPGAPVHLGHWCTGSRFTWCTGSPGALVHLGYSMTKHLCCLHYGLWYLHHCKQDSVWLPLT